jgi:hypothetical protein
VEVRSSRLSIGIKISSNVFISHLLFVDNVLCFSQVSLQDLVTLKGILDIYCKDTRMLINEGKSCLLTHNLPPWVSHSLPKKFPFPQKGLEEGFKYLNFNIKADHYWSVYWLWLVKKMEACVSMWLNQLISWGGN